MQIQLKPVGNPKLKISMALFMALILGGTARAIDWRTGDVVTIEKSEIIQDDLYVAGSDVRIDGIVNGDLMVGARTVTINGEVRGNLWASGETLILNGKVSQTVRLAGSVIRIQNGANVGRDLLAAGSEIILAPGSVIGRDVAFGSSQAHLNGKVNRNAYGGANGIEVGGDIGGKAQLAVGDTQVRTGNWIAPGTPGLRFLPGGHIGGDLTLQVPSNPTLPAGVVGGKLTYAPISGVTIPIRPNPFAQFLRTFAGIAVAVLLLVWLVQPQLVSLTQKLRTLPTASLGYGALALVGLPLAALLGVLVLVALAAVLTLLSLGNLGLPLAFIGVPVLLGVSVLVGWLALLAAQGFAAYQIGSLVLHTIQPNAGSNSVLLASLGGALVLSLLLQVPVLGSLLTLVALLLSLGALWLSLRKPGRPLTRPEMGAAQAT
jgi:cytoskeletal protein CcmA (bactofilin family)